jgi:hypothetical protein
VRSNGHLLLPKYTGSITLRKAMSSTSRRAGATEEIMGGRDASQPRKKNSVSVIPLYIFRWLSQLVDPQEIIECTASHEQAHMNGSRLQIKDL